MTGSAALALRLLGRELHAGELRLLLAATVIAVASITAVALFGSRMERILSAGANELIGADLVVESSRPIDPRLARAA